MFNVSIKTMPGSNTIQHDSLFTSRLSASKQRVVVNRVASGLLSDRGINRLLFFIQENLEDYNQNKLSTSQRRVLITQWVGHVWENMSSTMRETVVRGFTKCGISVSHDGSEDHLIHIEGLNNYTPYN